MAANFYGNPSSDFILVAVTGTDGKTSTCFLAEAAFKASGLKSGLIGTVYCRFNNTEKKSNLTTPDSITLQQMLKEMKKKGIEAVVMEASSHSLDQKRVEGCHFDIAVFTRMERDHLDYHRTFDAYFDAKKLLFTHFLSRSIKRKGALFNADDPLIKKFAQSRFNFRKLLFSLKKGGGEIFPIFFESDLKGIRAELSVDGETVEVRSRLLGENNLYNIMAVLGTAKLLDIDLGKACVGIEKLQKIPGRLEKVETGENFNVIIDYSHTPASVEKALLTLRPMTKGRLIIVMGCGGDRDKGKRPLMGKAAYTGADVIYVTSDNPRTEDPSGIIDDILAGISELKKEWRQKHVHVIEDRKEAIFHAIKSAQKDDMILIAGKGHEDFQITGTRKIHFSDAEVVREALGIEE
jgi:UDP-N-acetylmuramoyl-L-alanyl-D-glutamate--2,6-diaminopimelate ligase